MHSRQQATRSNQQALFRRYLAVCCLLPAVWCLTGCTSLSEYVHNGFKVGPNYKEPPASVAKKWIDADDKRSRRLFLTARGRGALVKALPIWKEAQMRMAQALKGADTDRFRAARSGARQPHPDNPRSIGLHGKHRLKRRGPPEVQTRAQERCFEFAESAPHAELVGPDHGDA